MTVVLFLISLAALERSPGFRSFLLSLALGLFSLKNIVLTYLYLIDDLPSLHPIMFVDGLVTGSILIRLLISRSAKPREESAHTITKPPTPATEEPPGELPGD